VHGELTEPEHVYALDSEKGSRVEFYLIYTLVYSVNKQGKLFESYWFQYFITSICKRDIKM
jgi:hypothetical protein